MMSQPQNKNVSSIFYIFQRRLQRRIGTRWNFTMSISKKDSNAIKAESRNFAIVPSFLWISPTMRYFFFLLSIFFLFLSNLSSATEASSVTELRGGWWTQSFSIFKTWLGVHVLYFNHEFSILFTNRKIKCTWRKGSFARRKDLWAFLEFAHVCSRRYF